MNATIQPTAKMAASVPVKAKPNLAIFNKLAPNITGIAKKNVNSAATVRDTPIIKEPTIVEPEREVPGKIAAINWKMPIINAVFGVISSNELMRGRIFL